MYMHEKSITSVTCIRKVYTSGYMYMKSLLQVHGYMYTENPIEMVTYIRKFYYVMLTHSYTTCR